MRALTVIAAVVLLQGCATFMSAVPEDYKGPLATIKDSVVPYSESKADFFYLTQVDDIRIENSRLKTLEVNRGRGMIMKPVVLDRKVPARESTYKIVGRTDYAAPILTLTNTVYQVTGDVRFAPQPDRTYVVKGVLGEDYSAVWIEDAEAKSVVGRKIEIKGSAKLGVFQK